MDETYYNTRTVIVSSPRRVGRMLCINQDNIRRRIRGRGLRPLVMLRAVACCGFAAYWSENEAVIAISTEVLETELLVRIIINRPLVSMSATVPALPRE